MWVLVRNTEEVTVRLLLCVRQRFWLFRIEYIPH